MVGRKAGHGRVQSSNWENQVAPWAAEGGSQGPAGHVRLPRLPWARPVCHVDPLGAWTLGLNCSQVSTPTTLHPHSPGPVAWPFHASISPINGVGGVTDNLAHLRMPPGSPKSLCVPCSLRRPRPVAGPTSLALVPGGPRFSGSTTLYERLRHPRISVIHRAPGTNCPWMPAYTGSSAFGPARETPGSDGMPRTTAGKTRTATQATAATPSTHSLHVNDGQAVVRHGVLTPRTRAAAPTFTPWSPFSPGSPRAPFSPYREKIKTRRH